MDWQTFWLILADAYREDAIEHVNALQERLAELRWFEILDFHSRFHEAIAKANTPELLAAALLINGDTSADGFRDFRVWLVSRGRHTYEHALRDADSLADALAGDPVDGFGFLTAALRVYEQKTGMSDFYARWIERDTTQPTPEIPAVLDSDETAIRKQLPRLAASYPPLPATDDDSD
jgi:hypothetical protein